MVKGFKPKCRHSPNYAILSDNFRIVQLKKITFLKHATIFLEGIKVP